jgi:hypothetical protein
MNWLKNQCTAIPWHLKHVSQLQFKSEVYKLNFLYQITFMTADRFLKVACQYFLSNILT